MYEAIFFDVDGTLLSMDSNWFNKEYISRVAGYFEALEPGMGKFYGKIVAHGGEVMAQNDGSRANDLLFWENFEQAAGKSRAVYEPLFLDFYRSEFPKCGRGAGDNGPMPEIVDLLTAKGYPLVVATNSVLPEAANKVRLQWAKVDHIPWRAVTNFEAYSHCKPDPRFFQEICDKLSLNPAKCLMIGNSVHDDGASMAVGMDFYLLTDEASPEDRANFQGRKGSRQDLLAFVQALPQYNAVV